MYDSRRTYAGFRIIMLSCEREMAGFRYPPGSSLKEHSWNVRFTIRFIAKTWGPCIRLVFLTAQHQTTSLGFFIL